MRNKRTAAIMIATALLASNCSTVLPPSIIMTAPVLASAEEGTTQQKIISIKNYFLENFEYDTDPNTSGIRITRYKGAGEVVIIPQEFDGKPVTSIYGTSVSGAFSDSSVKEVYLPDTLQRIESKAFANCRNVLISTYSGHNNNDNINTYLASDTNIQTNTLPSNLTTLGNAAFINCTTISEIIFPKEIADPANFMGTEVFKGCSNLVRVILPDNLQTISNNAFANTGIYKIDIPASVTTIGENAFRECNNLYDINFLNNSSITDPLLNIDATAFYNCGSLKCVYLPQHIAHVGYNAFAACDNLSYVFTPVDRYIFDQAVFSDSNKNNEGVEIDYLVPDERTPNFDADATDDKPDTRRPTIMETYIHTLPEWGGVKDTTGNIHSTKITASNINSYKKNTSTVTLNGLQGLNVTDTTHYYYINLSEANSIIKIDAGVFNSGTRVTSVFLPDSITTINTTIFGDETKLLNDIVIYTRNDANKLVLDLQKIYPNTSIQMTPKTSLGAPSNQKRIDVVPITTDEPTMRTYTEKIEGENNTRNIEETAINIEETEINTEQSRIKTTKNETFTMEGTLYFDDSVTEADIDELSFAGNTSLRYVRLPSSMTTIKDNMFQNCTSLITVDLPDGITTIGNFAFDGCTSLAKITLPDSIYNIGERAFQGCTNMPTVTIPESIATNKDRYIGIFAFDKATNPATTTTVIVTNHNLPNTNGITTDAFVNCELIIKGNWQSCLSDDTNKGTKKSVINETNSTATVAYQESSILPYLKYTTSIDNSSVTITGVQPIYVIDEFTGAIKYGTNADGSTYPIVAKENTDMVYNPYRNENTDFATLKEDSGSNLTTGELPTDIEIPEAINTLPVKEIAANAFANQNFTSVVIPYTVTFIGDSIFENCTHLEKVYLPENGSITTIPKRAFRNCEQLKQIYSYQNLADATPMLIDIAADANNDTINNAINNTLFMSSITAIQERAFENCKSIIGINLTHTDIRTVPSRTFAGCHALRYLVLPKNDPYDTTGNSDLHKGIESIGDNAFNGCIALESLEITPREKTAYGQTYTFTIDDYAFANCRSLKTLNLQRLNLTKIPAHAFEAYADENIPGDFVPTNQTDPTTKEPIADKYIQDEDENIILVPSNVELLIDATGKSAMYDKNGNVKTRSKRYTYNNETGEIIINPNDTIKMSLETLILPSTVKEIKEYAFTNCGNLPTIENFPMETITEIKDGTFMGCTKLVMTLPTKCTSIGNHACDGSQVGLAKIENGTTKSNSALAIPTTVKTIGAYAFANTIIQSSTLPSQITSLSEGVFSGCPALTHIDLSDTPITTLNPSVFENCTSLKEAVLPYNTTVVPVSFFSGCENLESVSLSKKTYGFSTQCFAKCNSLKRISYYEPNEAGKRDPNNTVLTTHPDLGELSFPDNDIIIQKEAFSDCTSFKTITFPNTIKTVYESCFKNNTALETVTFLDNMKYELNIAESMFEGCKNLKNFRIQNHKESTYQDDTDFQEYTDYTLAPKITSIDASAFKDCSSLTELTMSEKVTTIQPYTFAGCTNLKKLVLSPKHLHFSSYAFIGCNNLGKDSAEGFVIPDQVGVLPSGTFIDCDGITVTIPATVTDIKAEAWKSGTNITEYGNKTSSFINCNNLKIRGYKYSKAYDFYLLHKNVDGDVITDKTETIQQTGNNNMSFDIIDKDKYEDVSGDLAPFLKYVKKNDTIYITKLQSIKDSNGQIVNPPTNVTIPSYISGYPVVEIAAGAFKNTKITSLTLPDTVTFIGENMCSGCTQLESVTLPNNASLNTIPRNAFRDCTSLTTLKYRDKDNPDTLNNGLPETISTIARQAFYNCAALTTFNIPKNVKVIYSETFANCSKLQNITKTGDSFTTNNKTYIRIDEIESKAFQNCTSLTTFYVQPSEKNRFGHEKYTFAIGEYAFSGCTDMTNFELLNYTDIPKDIVTIERNTFANCEKLQSIEIPDTVTTIAREAFKNCKALSTVKLPENLKIIEISTFEGSGITSLTIPKACVTIENNAFAYCENLSTVNMKDATGLNNIGRRAFASSGITEIEIPPAVTRINDNTFFNCAKLREIKMHDGIETIGFRVFTGCTALENLTLPVKITNIQTSMFQNCIALQTVNFSSETTSIGSFAFAGCTSLKTTNIATCNNVKSIGASAFADCTKLRDFTIPNDITIIKNNTFENCNNLTSIVFNNNLKTIGDEAFMNCGNNPENTNSMDLILPESVTNIGDRAFFNCNRMNSIVLPTERSEIGESAFANCSSLTELKMPKNMSVLSTEIFSNCTALESITLPESLGAIRSNTFINCSSLKELEIPNSVRFLPSSVFNGCTALEQITIPRNVTSIRNDTFDESTLKTNNAEHDDDLKILGYTNTYANTFANNNNLLFIPLDIPNDEEHLDPNAEILNGVYYIKKGDAYEVIGCNKDLTEIRIYDNLGKLPITSISANAFANHKNLKAVRIGENVNNIGENAFINCESLTDVTLPSTLTTLNSRTFYGCEALESITLPETITTINSNTFLGCHSLTLVKLPVNLSTIAANTFFDCTSLSTVILPNKLEIIDECAFKGCTKLETISFAPCNATLKAINKNAFEGSGLTEITLPNNITTLGNGIFTNCKKLETVNFAKNTTEISDNTFNGCTALTKLNITNLDNLTTIGDYAFANSGLTEFTLPAKVDTVGAHAFENCTTLTKFDFNGNTALKSLSQNMFTNTGFTEFTIPDHITKVGAHAFKGCQALKTITFNSKLSAVNMSTFQNCTALKTINIPETSKLFAIGESAFDGCNALETFTVPSGTRYIYANAFSNCTNLKTVTLAKATDTIDIDAFNNDPNLVLVVQDGTNGLTYAQNGSVTYAVNSETNTQYIGKLKAVNLAFADYSTALLNANTTVTTTKTDDDNYTIVITDTKSNKTTTYNVNAVANGSEFAVTITNTNDNTVPAKNYTVTTKGATALNAPNTVITNTLTHNVSTDNPVAHTSAVGAFFAMMLGAIVGIFRKKKNQ